MIDIKNIILKLVNLNFQDITAQDYLHIFLGEIYQQDMFGNWQKKKLKKGNQDCTSIPLHLD